MRSICNISQGFEIYNTYGKLGNSELLRKYGFVDGLDNPHNIVTISLQTVLDAIKHTDLSNFTEKLDFLKQHRLLSNEETFLLTKKKKILKIKIVMKMMKIWKDQALIHF